MDPYRYNDLQELRAQLNYMTQIALDTAEEMRKVRRLIETIGRLNPYIISEARDLLAVDDRVNKALSKGAK